MISRVLWNALGALLVTSLVATTLLGQPEHNVRVELGPARISLGVESEEGPELFGDVRAALLDDRARILVLDASDQSVRIFDSRGAFVTRFGRPGRGPGDLSVPTGLLLLRPGHIGAVDQINGISVHDVRSLEPRFVDVFGRHLRPRAACISRGVVYVAGFAEDSLVHRFSNKYESGGSFGAGFSSDTSPAVRELANRSPVVAACATERSIIVVAQNEGPLVRGFTESGRLLWQSRLPSYRGNFYFRDRRGYLTTGYGDDYTVGLHVLPGGAHLLAQVQRIRRTGGGVGRARRIAYDVTSVTSYILEAASGRIVGRRTDIPRILDVRDSTAIAYFDQPYPRVEVRSLRLR